MLECVFGYDYTKKSNCMVWGSNPRSLTELDLKASVLTTRPTMPW